MLKKDFVFKQSLRQYTRLLNPESMIINRRQLLPTSDLHSRMCHERKEMDIGQMDIVKSLPRETRSDMSTVRAVMSWAGTELLADTRFKLRTEG